MKKILITTLTLLILTQSSLTVFADTPPKDDYLRQYTREVDNQDAETSKEELEAIRQTIVAKLELEKQKKQEEKQKKLEEEKRLLEEAKAHTNNSTQETTTTTEGSSLIGSDNFTIQSFIDFISPKAKVISSKYGMWTSLAIANAIQESTYGNSYNAKNGNNLFGIKAYSDWTGATVGNAPANEDNGQSIPYRAYTTVEDSIEDFYKLLQADRYTSIREADNVYDALKFHETGYAGDSTKDIQLKNYLDSYNLTQYDTEPVQTTQNNVTNVSTNNQTSSVATSKPDEELTPEQEEQMIRIETMKEFIRQQAIKELLNK